MRQAVVLLSVCVVLLVGAWLASRALLSDVSAPTTEAGVNAGPNLPGTPPEPTPVATPTAPVEALRPPEPLAPVPVPTVTPTAIPPSAVVHAGAAEADAGEPMGDAPSPYLGPSRELDYAEAMLEEAQPTRDRVQSARDVFERCLELHPDNERCAAGLERAAVKYRRLPPLKGYNQLAPNRELLRPNPKR